MITKERLEELIQKKATIWVGNKYSYAYSVDLDINYIGIADGKDSLFTLDYSINDKGETVLIDYLEYLFETKEDAEFACKYQNISRFDCLNLPTYEDFVKNYQSFGDELITDEKCVIFSCKDGLYSLYACDNEIWVGKDSDGSVMFHKELNKENYIKACDICVKLFKGEES